MARKIENNVYEDDSNVMGTVFLSGLTAGSVYTAVKPDHVKEVGTKVFNKVFPKVTPKVSPDSYLGRLHSTQAKILASRANSLEIKAAHTAGMRQRSGGANKFLGSVKPVNPVLTVDDLSIQSRHLSERFTFNNADEVVDAAGNSLIPRFQQAIQNVTGEKTSFLGFNGTVGRFSTGGKEVTIPFAKYDSVTSSWLIRENQSIQVAPYMAETVDMGGRPGMSMMEYNTYLLRNMENQDRLIWNINDRFNNRDAIEMLNRTKGADLDRVDNFVNKAMAGDVITKVDDSYKLQKAVNRLRDLAERTHSNNSSSIGRIGSIVKFDHYTRKHLADALGLKGFDAESINADAITMAGKPKYTSEGLMSFFSLLRQVKENPELLSVETATGTHTGSYYGLTGIGEMARLAPQHLGWTLGQTHTAQGYAGIRELPYLMQAEANKSEKGLRFQRSLRTPKGMVRPEDRFAFRHMPIYFDEGLLPISGFDDLGKPMFNVRGSSSPYAKSLASTFENMGVQNVLSVLDPFSIEAISVKDAKKVLPTLENVTDKVTSFLAPGDIDEDEAQKIFNKLSVNYRIGDNDFGTTTLNDLMSDKDLRHKIIHGDGVVFINKGTPLGFLETGGQILSAEELEGAGEVGSKIVRADTDRIITADNLAKMELFNATKGETDNFVVMSERITDPKKIALYGMRSRSSLHEGINPDLAKLQRFTGSNLGLEATMSKGLFDKVMLTSNQMEKGSPELMQFLHGSIHGHIWGYENLGNIRLEGEALEQVKPYLNFINSRDDWDGNLTQLLREGKLSFKTAYQNEETLGRQFDTMYGLLGQIRKHFTENAKGSLVLGSIDSDTGKDILQDHWENLNAENMRRVLDDLGPDPKLSKILENRKQAWHFTAGLMPQETMFTAQGGDFNMMRINFKSLGGLAKHGDILEELSISNVNDSIKMMHELELIRHSWMDVDDKDAINLWKKTEEAYEGLMGGKIPVYTKDQIVSALSGDSAIGLDTSNWLQNLKSSPDMFNRSFLSMDNNPMGFYVQDGKTRRYIGSAELYRGVYQLPEGTGTFDSYATQTAKMLYDLARNPENELDEVTRKSFKLMTAAHMASSTEGLTTVASMQLREGLYSINKESVNLLQNEDLLKRIRSVDGANGNIEHTLGSTVIESVEDYSNRFKQMMKTYAETAGADETVADVMRRHFGDDHIFSNLDLDFLGTELDGKRLGSLNKTFLENQIGIAKKFGELVDGYSKGNVQADEIHKLLEGAMMGFGVRHPDVYAGSYFSAHVLPDVAGATIGAKEIAIGNTIKTLTTGDTDGDKISLKWLIGRKARKETVKNINFTQKEISKWMAAGAENAIGKAIFGNNDAVEILRNVDMQKLSRTLINDMPEATAMAAFYTKALTGSVNIKAATMKGHLRGKMSDSDLGLSDVEKFSNFFDSMISRVTEQQTISSKHLSSIVGEKNNIESVTALINSLRSEQGREVMIDSIKKSQSVNPLIMMAWGHMSGTNGEMGVPDTAERNLAEAIETFVDLQTFSRKHSVERIERMHSLFGEGDFDTALAKINAAWDKMGNVGGLETEAAENLGLRGKSFLGLLHDAQKESGLAATDRLESLFKAAKGFARKGDVFAQSQEADALLSLLTNPKRRGQYDAKEMFLDPITSQVAPKARRILAGTDRIVEFADNVMKRMTPLKAAGMIGAGLIGMRVLNMVSGDGSPENPYDSPTVANQSFEGSRYNDLMATRNMSAKGNYNSNGTLLTDNTVSYEDALAEAGNNGMIGDNNVSIRHDGHNPYKSDMMLYN